jgi:hypothetical protein
MSWRAPRRVELGSVDFGRVDFGRMVLGTVELGRVEFREGVPTNPCAHNNARRASAAERVSTAER